MTKKLMIVCMTLLLGALLLGIGGDREVHMIRIDEKITHQTLESFGTSAAWWSQYMGLWDMPYQDSGRSVREQIALWLFDRKEGIGLTNYRYNLGAGSADSGNGRYPDVHRRAQSFESAPGVYDWGKDAGAFWFVSRAAELGVEDVVLFFNSPLERLTDNGWAHLTPGGSTSNITPDKYAAWAVYACDVAEHFLESGVPVKFLSPINEPQWEWTGGQEGCHFEPEEIAAVYRAFLEEMNRRPALSGVELTGPECGEWKGNTYDYVAAMLADPVLREHMDGVDCHSYWSDAQNKTDFKAWLEEKYPEKKVRMSEWCEMVSGTDVTMDSAIHLAQCVAEDLTLMDAVHWATWVGVSPGGYRDGVIHAAPKGEDDASLTALKRLWAYGNYTRYIRPGFTRVEATGGEDFRTVAFTGEEEGKRKLVLVLINEEKKEKAVALEGDFSRYPSMAAYETSADRDLQQVVLGDSRSEFTLAPLSVTTIVFSE